MRTATELLADYAACHRDQRNIASHFVALPLMIFSIGVLLARPAVAVDAALLSPAGVLFILAASWFLTRGDLLLGAAVSLATGLLLFCGHRVAHAGGLLVWLSSGVGLFLVGWTVQAIGHWYEGRKPDPVAGLAGLLVGPMFLAAELLFMTGWNKPLMAEIERRAGPTRLRDLARIA